MARKIIFPIIIFFTLLAASNVRSLPLLTLAYAEIIFAGIMIVLSLFQRNRLNVRPARSFLSFQKNHTTDCKILVDNAGIFPLNRFCLEMSHGYDSSDESPIVLYGGTDKKDGFLSVNIDNKFCGINILRLNKVKCYDWFLLSSFSKKIDKTVKIAVLPDDNLKIKMILSEKPYFAETWSSEDLPAVSRNSGTEIRDIRPYREGDTMRSIYWKQSAKMNELWVKEFTEDIQSSPVIEIPSEDILSLDTETSDTFYRIFYALLSGVYDISGKFVLRCTRRSGGYFDHYINDLHLLKLILICFYKNDITPLKDHYIEQDIAPVFVLKIDPSDLSLIKNRQVIKKFHPKITDQEINETVLII